MVLRKVDMHMQREKTGTLPYTTQINPKWIKDLNIKHENVKLLGRGRKSCLTLVLAMIFLDMEPKAQITKAKISKSGLHQTKKLL